MNIQEQIETAYGYLTACNTDAEGTDTIIDLITDPEFIKEQISNILELEEDEQQVEEIYKGVCEKGNTLEGCTRTQIMELLKTGGSAALNGKIFILDMFRRGIVTLDGGKTFIDDSQNEKLYAVLDELGIK